jgi:hypothetical protein
MAFESWGVLFSQRRQWINSAIHNLFELVILPELWLLLFLDEVLRFH